MHFDNQVIADIDQDKKSSSLRIALNARPLGTVFTGVARYVRCLYSAIEQLGLAEVIYYHSGRAQNNMPVQSNTVVSNYLPCGIRKIARIAHMKMLDRRLSQILSKNGVDIYHETGMFPMTLSRTVPKVITIYDLSLITHPECHPTDRVQHFEKYFYNRLSEIDHIITISKFIESEIIKILGVNRNKVTAIPLASSTVFSRKSSAEVKKYLRVKKLPENYVLSIGTYEPRKNYIGLIRSFSKIKSNMSLICVGWSGWLDQEYEKEIRNLGLQGRVILLGHLPDSELTLLYSGAKFFIYPSIYEGFGLPILEAMATGCPVICSNRASMPEVAGDAARLVNSEDIDSMAQAVEELAEDEFSRKILAKKGLERARQFTWERTARQTIDVLSSCCG